MHERVLQNLPLKKQDKKMTMPFGHGALGFGLTKDI